MKVKFDLDAIEKSIDYEGVIQRLETLTDSGNFKRRKKITDLLDKLKPALLRARENKVPIKTLAQFVRDSGIPITDANFQKYLRNQRDAGLNKEGERDAGPGKKKKNRPKPDSIATTSETASRQPSDKAISSSETAPSPKKELDSVTRKLPPRLAKHHLSKN